MKKWIITTSVAVVLATIVAAGSVFPMVREAEATSFTMTTRLGALNGILSDDYNEWVLNYDTYKSTPTNVWMDWSEDGCSVPGIIVKGGGMLGHQGGAKVYHLVLQRRIIE